MLAILPKIAFLFTILTDFVYYWVKINEFLGIFVYILEKMYTQNPFSIHCVQDKTTSPEGLVLKVTSTLQP